MYKVYKDPECTQSTDSINNRKISVAIANNDDGYYRSRIQELNEEIIALNKRNKVLNDENKTLNDKLATVGILQLFC